MDRLQLLDSHAIAGVRAESASTTSSASDGAAFAHALTHAAAPPRALDALVTRAPGDASVLDRLAVHLESIERKRVEAGLLPERVAQAHADGAGTAGLAVAMHRQARLMAAYNLDVLWTAKIVGTATASLKQLIAAA